MAAMLVTELVSQPEMSALNDDAPSNMLFTSVTELTSHAEMPALKDVAPINMPRISVTLLTSQKFMSHD